MVKLLSAVFLLAQAAAAQTTETHDGLLFSRTLDPGQFGGIASIAVEPSGNLVVAGSTNAFDLPVTNGTRNTGTAISVSLDAGRTWQPVTNPPVKSVYSVAIDSSDPQVLLAGGEGIARSTDGGQTWQLSADFSRVRDLAADVSHPGTVYAATAVGLFKTTDAGLTWQHADAGIPNADDPVYELDYLVLDPLDPQTIYTAMRTQTFRTHDGGASWEEYQLPDEAQGVLQGRDRRVAFDGLTVGTLYHAGFTGLFRSGDAGRTWEKLATPFTLPRAVLTDTSRAGVVYVQDASEEGARSGGIYRSRDGGSTWETLLVSQGTSVTAVDPFDSNIVISGAFRTEDGGATWQTLALKTGLRIVFDPRVPGRVWAAAPTTSDGFLARLDPSGQHTLFASYFGARGDDYLNEFKTDTTGNLYVLGIARDPYPAEGASFNAGPGEDTDRFVAKFDSGFNLLWITFVASSTEHFAVAPDGGVVALGGFGCMVQKLTADGSLEFQKTLVPDDYCRAVAVAPNGDIAVSGYDSHSRLAATPDALQPQPKGPQDGILLKLDSQGSVLFATYLGGTYVKIGPPQRIDGAGETTIDALAFDRDGNLVLAGSTETTNFPTTPGAIQSQLRANCPYPSSAVATGFIGTILSYRMHDVFVTKLNADGTTILASTLLGGDCYEQVSSLGVDPDGGIWVGGRTDSNPFPQVSPFQAGPAPQDYAGFVAEMDPAATRLLLSSYLPADAFPDLTFDRAGNTWLAANGYLAKIGQDRGPEFQVSSVGNLFSGRNGPVVAGEYTHVAVDGLDPGGWAHLTWTPADPLPRELLGVEVLFDGEPAAVYAVGPGFVECIAPHALVGQTSTVVQVRFGGLASQALRVDVQTSDVALLSADGSGTGRAAARNQDGTLNSPGNPAAPGTVVRFYFTGADVVGLGCPEGGTESEGTAAPVVTSPYGHLQSYALPGFLCGIYEVRLPIPEDWETQLDAPISLEHSPVLTFSVQR